MYGNVECRHQLAYEGSEFRRRGRPVAISTAELEVTVSILAAFQYKRNAESALALKFRCTLKNAM